jgi:hypothetical protein
MSYLTGVNIGKLGICPEQPFSPTSHESPVTFLTTETIIQTNRNLPTANSQYPEYYRCQNLICLFLFCIFETNIQYAAGYTQEHSYLSGIKSESELFEVRRK